PPELATPALLNRMTGRSIAKPSVTLGSQLSSPPRKCCRNTTGVPVAAPNRLYAYVTPFASMNRVGEVLCELVMAATAGSKLRLLGNDVEDMIILLQSHGTATFSSGRHSVANTRRRAVDVRMQAAFWHSRPRLRYPVPVEGGHLLPGGHYHRSCRIVPS